MATPTTNSLAGMPGIARRLAAEGVVSEDQARKAVEESSKQKITLVSFFVQNGIRYSHILDPATGRPARVLSSATIIADTGTDADAWATALFVKGPQTLKDELEKRGMDWIAVDLEGNITTSGPMREFCPEKLPEPRKN